ncbi:hypothetical protein GCM10027044_20020 [Hymenobacter ruber]
MRTELFNTSLSRTQRQTKERILSTANPNVIQQQCSSNTATVDDGFHLDVTITKPNISKSFRWNGNYVNELAALLDVINEVSPEKYKFYESSQKEAFKQSLLRNTDTP